VALALLLSVFQCSRKGLSLTNNIAEPVELRGK